MSVLLVVQAGQVGSKLRDSQLLPFGDGTVLSTALARLEPFGESSTVVAISDLPEDGEIDAIAQAAGCLLYTSPSPRDS